MHFAQYIPFEYRIVNIPGIIMLKINSYKLNCLSIISSSKILFYFIYQSTSSFFTSKTKQNQININILKNYLFISILYINLHLNIKTILYFIIYVYLQLICIHFIIDFVTKYCVLIMFFQNNYFKIHFMFMNISIQNQVYS